MIGVCIFLLTLTLFSLTRIALVKIIKDDIWGVEIHFPLSAIAFFQNDSDKKKNKKNKRKPKKPTAYYVSLIRRLLKLSEVSEVHISQLVLPVSKIEYASLEATRPWGYHTLISTMLAYLGSQSKKLTIDDNAIILNPDEENLKLNIIFKVRLFYLLRAILYLRKDDVKHKKQRKKHVGK